MEKIIVALTFAGSILALLFALLMSRKVLKFSEGNDLMKKISLSIDDPREDLLESEIKSAMDLVISKNVFAPGGADIVEAISAKVVVTDTTPYDLEI